MQEAHIDALRQEHDRDVQALMAAHQAALTQLEARLKQEAQAAIKDLEAQAAERLEAEKVSMTIPMLSAPCYHRDMDELVT
jgi:hypothetical protein